MRTNVKAPSVPAPRTHEGAVAVRITPILELRRTVMCCLLWEDTFYESGVSVAQRITDLCATCDPDAIAALAVEARNAMKLRHVPLLLARELVRRKVNVAALLPQIIQRPDELTEFLALYWKDGKVPLAASVKRGLAASFQRFNAYALAKYNRADAIKLRDVLFLSHAKPKDDEQAATWKQLVDGTLPVPDTWEVALSGGDDKRAAWTRMLTENKLGALALLKNLRNMEEAGVERDVIRAALTKCRTDRVLPFRFITAARYAPQMEPALEALMLRELGERPKLPGKTVLVIDVSGSMQGRLSDKSDVSRLDTAAALAILVREVCVDAVIYATAGSDARRVHETTMVPSRRGFALRDTVVQSMHQLGGGGIFLRQCCDFIKERESDVARLIVLTDEQDCDQKLNPATAPTFGRENYLVNVATYQHGIGYGKWTHIDGWSEAIMDFIQASEAQTPTTN
jgi:60 kDa SS-A/Ro ribonucleoprotein